jgi:hypothetical protein
MWSGKNGDMEKLRISELKEGTKFPAGKVNFLYFPDGVFLINWNSFQERTVIVEE